MKKYFMQISGLAILVLLLQTFCFAQDEGGKDKENDKQSSYEEIIIKHKSDKDAKVTIEIRNGEVLVDGKPMSDFDDSTLSIHKQKIKTFKNRTFSLSGPDGNDVFVAPESSDGNVFFGPQSPFRGHDGSVSGYGNYNSNQAYLGVSSEKPSDGQGAKVTSVTDGSAAEVLGLRSGDIITKVDETAVTDPQSLSAAIRKHKPADKVTVTYSRDGKSQKGTATLGKMREPKSFNFEYNMPELKQNLGDMYGRGLMLEDMNGRSMRLGIKAQDTEDGKGVKVLDVDDESNAAKAGIKEGDIITRFDGKDINSATALAEAARAAKERPSVHVSLLRDGKAQEVDVKIPKKLRTANL
jgi:serine protease Do